MKTDTHTKAKTEMGSLVFVYGTLMRRHHNHHVMERAGGEFVCNAKTVNKYPLKVTGLPYLLNIPGEGMQVHGELYNMPTEGGIAVLDKLEGHPTFYTRSHIEVRDEAGNVLRVQVYFYRDYARVADKPDHACFE